MLAVLSFARDFPLAVGGAVAAAFLCNHFSEAGVAASMCAVFEAGGRPGWARLFRKDRLPRVRRDELHAGLTAMLQPTDKAEYCVVVGASGTGKSTALRKALLELPTPRGAVYFLPASTLAGFSVSLARTVGFYRPTSWIDAVKRALTGETKEETLPPPSETEPRASWQLLEPFLLKAAGLYAAKYSVPATLVLDGMDLVAKADAAFFATLLDFAKRCADAGVLQVVLVVSDGAALPLLQSSSAITRADVILEVPDLPDAAAVDWLIRDYKVPSPRAADLVAQLAGGRFPLLRMCGTSPLPLDMLRDRLDRRCRHRLAASRVDAAHCVFAALLAAPDGRLEFAVAERLLAAGELDALLRNNILSAHPDDTVGFQDRHTQRFFERRRGGEAMDATAGAEYSKGSR